MMNFELGTQNHGQPQWHLGRTSLIWTWSSGREENASLKKASCSQLQPVASVELAESVHVSYVKHVVGTSCCQAVELQNCGVVNPQLAKSEQIQSPSDENCGAKSFYCSRSQRCG